MAPALIAARRAAPRAMSAMSVVGQQVRGMATEKQIWNQIQATKNIQKITASMKMVSAAKLKGDETRLEKAIPFNNWAYALCPEPALIEDATYEDLPKRVLIVPFTSDKGLCGGINSFITRGTREMVKKLHAQGKEADVVIIGDKGRGQLKRSVPDCIIQSNSEVISPGTFALASALSAELMEVNCMEYDAVVLLYNSYVNAAVYNQTYKVVPPFVFEGESEVSLSTYEFDSDKAEAMGDLYEFMLASQIFHSFMDGAAAEQSSRMTAMENASKNAGEMIDSLTLRYNRARQSRITTELIEIISGASALEDEK